MPQPRRHAFIASLLGLQHITIAINKMDSADFREDVFGQICADFGDFATQLHVPDLFFIPLSGTRRFRRSAANRSQAECSPDLDHQTVLDPGKVYIEKNTTRSAKARVFGARPGLNEIGTVTIVIHVPLFVDPYERNRASGSQILIDPVSDARWAPG